MEPIAVQIQASGPTVPPDMRAVVDACFQIQDTDTMLRSLDFVLGSNILDGAIAILETTNAAPKICKIHGPSRSLTFVQGHHRHQFYLCIMREECEYCSCRSFIERCRKNEPYCKHLLALKLYPLLGVPESTIVRVEHLPDETSFRNMVMQRLFVKEHCAT